MSDHIQGNHFDNVVTFLPNGEFYFRKGINAFQRHDLRLAKKYLYRAWQLEPNEPIIACQYAITLAELEEYQQSNEILNKILTEMDSYMHECHYFLANNYAYLGLYREAINEANIYLQKQPYGEFANDTKELIDVISEEENIEDWLQDEKLQEENELIDKQEFVKSMLARGEFTEAEGYLQEMIEQFPTFWPAYNNLALAYYYNGKRDEAKAIVEEVLEENHGNLHALCNLTVFYYYDGEDIQNELEVLKKVHPISIDHRYKLGVTFAIVGEYQEAYKWLKSLVIVGFEGDASFYYWLSYSAYFTGKKQYAKKVWEKLLKLDPEKEGSEPWNQNSPVII